jgi:aryl-alcohol dehydrogenase-like predicted oxidoreductase
LLTLAMSWLAAQPVTASIIAGGSKPEQMAANANAIQWKMTAENLHEIDAVVAGA